MVLALTNNHYIISQVDEVATEDIGQPDCKLTRVDENNFKERYRYG